MARGRADLGQQLIARTGLAARDLERHGRSPTGERRQEVEKLKTKPIRLPRNRASASPTSVMSAPSISIRPVDGASRPASSRAASTCRCRRAGDRDDAADSMRRSSGSGSSASCRRSGRLGNAGSSIMKRRRVAMGLSTFQTVSGDDARALDVGMDAVGWFSPAAPPLCRGGTAAASRCALARSRYTCLNATVYPSEVRRRLPTGEQHRESASPWRAR